MKTNTRYMEHIRKDNFKKSWLLSYKFSKQMYNYIKCNIDIISEEELVNYCKSIIGQYKGEIIFPFKKNYKFVRIWLDFKNSVDKNTKEKIIFNTKHLYYTSFKNNI